MKITSHERAYIDSTGRSSHQICTLNYELDRAAFETVSTDTTDLYDWQLESWLSVAGITPSDCAGIIATLAKLSTSAELSERLESGTGAAEFTARVQVDSPAWNLFEITKAWRFAEDGQGGVDTADLDFDEPDGGICYSVTF